MMATCCAERVNLYNKDLLAYISTTGYICVRTTRNIQQLQLATTKAVVNSIFVNKNEN